WLIAVFAGLIARAYCSFAPPPRDPNALRKAALAVPAVGIALLLPITLHMIAMHKASVRELDEWVTMSVMFTTHTHVVFVLFAASRALALANGEKPIG